jgi:hypothetical protein
MSCVRFVIYQGETAHWQRKSKARENVVGSLLGRSIFNGPLPAAEYQGENRVF